MREILFRGKGTGGYHNGKWVYGFCVKDFWGKERKGHGIIPINDEEGGYCEVDPETVGQYTGLTDKNGTKIFEGDIVRYPDCASYVEYDEDYNEGFVDWCEETMCFYFTNRWKIEMEDFELVGNKLVDVEVIGNIHDNPELLKGE